MIPLVVVLWREHVEELFHDGENGGFSLPRSGLVQQGAATENLLTGAHKFPQSAALCELGPVGMLIRNPIVYTFAAIGAALLIFSVFLGVHFLQTLQLIFVPYTYDITRGVGATGSKIYSIALGMAQIGLFALTIFGIKMENNIARRVVWGIGVVLVFIYFIVIVLGYLVNNFH